MKLELLVTKVYIPEDNALWLFDVANRSYAADTYDAIFMVETRHPNSRGVGKAAYILRPDGSYTVASYWKHDYCDATMRSDFFAASTLSCGMTDSERRSCKVHSVHGFKPANSSHRDIEVLMQTYGVNAVASSKRVADAVNAFADRLLVSDCDVFVKLAGIRPVTVVKGCKVTPEAVSEVRQKLRNALRVPQGMPEVSVRSQDSVVTLHDRTKLAPEQPCCWVGGVNPRSLPQILEYLDEVVEYYSGAREALKSLLDK